MKRDAFCELVITAAKGHEQEAYDFLARQVGEERIVVVTGGGSYEHKAFFRDATEAEALAVQARSLGLDACTGILYRKDWAEPWKKHVNVVRLTERYSVVPAWLDPPAAPDERTILIDTSLSFGLGDHPTTQMLASIVERYMRPGSSFLDVGTGTGILSILAARRGAVRVTAFDSSNEAVERARDNLAMNACHGTCLCARLEDFHTQDRYAFVAANLDTVQLVEHAGRLLALTEPGGHLAISGVSSAKLDLFRAEFNASGARLVHSRSKGSWCAFLFRRMSAAQE